MTTPAIDSVFCELARAKLAPIVLDLEAASQSQKLFLTAQSNVLFECVPHGLSLGRRLSKPHEVSKQAVFDVQSRSHTESPRSSARW
jgi:hypothetical protein